MPILGMRTTANFVATERPENWRQGITLLYPRSAKVRQAPLTALTSVMKERSVSDPVYHWFEKELNNRRFLLTANLGATAGGAAGTFTVDATYNPATGVKKNDVLLVEGTGEVVIVSADPTATNTIAVLRGANTGGAGLAHDLTVAGTNPYAMVIGSAFEEASDAPTGVNFDPTDRSNNTQIFRSTLEMTGTAEATELRTGDQVKEAKREALEYFSVDMERAFWFGKKGSGTVNGKPRRMMSGLIEQINAVSSANIITLTGTNVSAGVDMDWWEGELMRIFQYGSSEKVIFGGNKALLTLGQVVRKNSTMNISSGIKEYGMSVSRFSSAFGDLVFIPHPLFSQNTGGTVGGTAFYGMEGWMAVLDMEYIKYVYLKGRDVKYQKDLTPVGLDGMKSGYLGEVSIELNHAKAHFLYKNVVKAKKDA